MKSLLTGFVCFIAACAALVQGAEGDSGMMPTNGLIAFYPFNGNANDESGKGHPAKVTGASPTQDRFGRAQHAYAFDGEKDEIVIDPPPPLSSTGFSVSVWVTFTFPEKHSEWKDIGDGAIVCRDPVIGQDDGYAVRCFQLWVWKGNLLWHRMNEYSSVWTEWPLEREKWYHVVATFDGNEHVLYVDGRKEWSARGILKISVSEPVRIGSKGDVLVRKRAFFTGAIDDVRFYDRALEGSEVQGLYAEKPEETK